MYEPGGINLMLYCRAGTRCPAKQIVVMPGRAASTSASTPASPQLPPQLHPSFTSASTPASPQLHLSFHPSFHPSFTPASTPASPQLHLSFHPSFTPSYPHKSLRPFASQLFRFGDSSRHRELTRLCDGCVRVEASFRKQKGTSDPRHTVAQRSVF
ncbi:hypothetical protein JOQ06_022492, partial [Pogonophryne albipinna]